MFLNTCTGVHISTTNLGKKFTERFVWKLPLDQESIWKMLHSSQPACTSSALPTSESTKAVIRITYIAFQKPYLTWTGMFVASSFCSAQSFSKSNCPSHTGQTSSIPLKACYFPWAQIYLFIYLFLLHFFLLPSQAKVSNMLHCFLPLCYYQVTTQGTYNPMET